jgi:hypothetical protein
MKIGKLPMGAPHFGPQPCSAPYFGLQAVLGRPNADLMP